MCECDLGGKNIIGYESMMQLIWNFPSLLWFELVNIYIYIVCKIYGTRADKVYFLILFF